MAKINSRQKGKRGELELAKILRERGWEARRGQQYQGGTDSPDVVHNIPGIHFEAKWTEKLQLYKAMEQAYNDAFDMISIDALGSSTFAPVVVHKKKRTAPVAILWLDDLLDILKELEDLRERKKGLHL